ncbi:MAG TPA: hypothetical protein PK264_15775, partial [Hyphomicrobiaceae bacterium]|nr:hypothetical protein [Hyphomicrobiaceae bacterium]
MAANTLTAGQSVAPASERPRRSRRIALDLVGFADALAVAAGGLVPAFIYAKIAGLPINWAAQFQAG